MSQDIQKKRGGVAFLIGVLSLIAGLLMLLIQVPSAYLALPAIGLTVAWAMLTQRKMRR